MTDTVHPQAQRGAAFAVAHARLSALKDLPEKVSSALQRAIVSQEYAIEDLIAREGSALAYAIGQRGELYTTAGGRSKLKGSDEMKRLSEQIAQHEQRFNALKIFYEHVAQVYYATGSTDIDHIVNSVAKEITSLKSDIKDAFSDENYRKPFERILAEAEKNVGKKSQLLSRIRATGSKIIGSNLFQAGLAAAASRSPIVGLAVMSMSNKPVGRTQLGMDTERADRAYQRSGHFSVSKTRQGAGPSNKQQTPTGAPPSPVTPAPTPIDVPPPFVASTVDVNTFAGNGPTRTQSPIGNQQNHSSTNGVLTILHVHTKLLQGIHLHTRDTVKELKRLFETNTLAAEESAFETNGRHSHKGFGVGADKTNGAEPNADKGILDSLTSVVPSIIDGLQTLMISKFGLKALGSMGPTVLKHGAGMWSKVMSRLPAFGRAAGAAAAGAATTVAAGVGNTSGAAPKPTPPVRVTNPEKPSLGTSLMGGGKGALRWGGRAVSAAGRIAGKLALPVTAGFAAYDAYKGFNANRDTSLGSRFENAGSSALNGFSFGLFGKSPEEIAASKNPDAPTRMTKPSKMEFVDRTVAELSAQGITDPNLINAILGNILKESGGIPRTEVSYKNTSNDSIRKIFPTKTKNLSDAELDTIKKDDDAFFGLVYGKLGGKDYRGRGLIQITGADNYRRYGNMIGVDLIKNPELANDPTIAAKIAAAFMKDNLPRLRRKMNMTAGPLNKNDALMLATSTIAGRPITAGRGFHGNENLTRARDGMQEAQQYSQRGDATQSGRASITSSLSPTQSHGTTSVNAPTVTVNNITSTNSGGHGGRAALGSPVDNTPTVRDLIHGR